MDDPTLCGAAGFYLLSVILVVELGLTWQESAEWDWELLNRGDIVLIAGSILLSAVFFRLALPKNNALRLDDRGLTYRSGGRVHVWPWHELSVFSLGPGTWRGRCIRFTAAKWEGWWRTGRFPLLTIKAGPRGSFRGEVWDVWDAPLDEIAATLNDYRGQALGTEAGVRA